MTTFLLAFAYFFIGLFSMALIVKWWGPPPEKKDFFVVWLIWPAAFIFELLWRWSPTLFKALGEIDRKKE